MKNKLNEIQKIVDGLHEAVIYIEKLQEENKNLKLHIRMILSGIKSIDLTI
jgi:hypothetical protein